MENNILSEFLTPIKNETELDQMISLCDYLMDNIKKNNGNNKLECLLDIIGNLIGEYESKNYY